MQLAALLMHRQTGWMAAASTPVHLSSLSARERAP